MASFRPHPALVGGHLQTIFAYLYTLTPELEPDETIVVRLEDGDEIVLDVNFPTRSAGDRPAVYLLHGLGGSSRSSYQVRIARKLLQLGFPVIRHNHRGCGEQRGRARGIYHSGSKLDILAGLRAIATRWPQRSILTVAFSLSGTMLLNLLGTCLPELKELPQLKAAMAICPPIDLVQSSQAMSAMRNRHYDLYYTKKLISQMLERRLIDIDFVQQSLRDLTLRRFDEVITIPLGGFLSPKDYYESCSPKNCVANIRLPTVILAAFDDPIIPAKPVMQASYSTRAVLLMEASGGHLGFISAERTPFGDHRWLDFRVTKWVQALAVGP